MGWGTSCPSTDGGDREAENGGVMSLSDTQLREAVKLAMDAGEYDRAAVMLAVFRERKSGSRDTP